MEIDIKIDTSMKRLLEEEYKIGAAAVTSTMRDASISLKNRLRSQVVRAGLGQRVAKAFQSMVKPEHANSMSAQGFVWSKAPKIHAAFNEGPLIRAGNGYWLAIPTPAAGKGKRGKHITPKEWMARTGIRLRMIARPGKNPILVADLRRRTGKRGGYAAPSPTALRTGRGLERDVHMFTLVRQVKLRKHLDVLREAEDIGRRIPDEILRRWR